MAEQQGWICDGCHGIIKQPQDGCVEWIDFKDFQGNSAWRDLRLVHRNLPIPSSFRCQFDEAHEFQKDGGIIRDLPLEKFLGSDGLMLLLSFIAQEKLPNHSVLEMTKRLHIPGYEHARGHFEQAIYDGVFEPNTLPGYYYKWQIEEVIKYIGNQTN